MLSVFTMKTMAHFYQFPGKIQKSQFSLAKTVFLTSPIFLQIIVSNGSVDVWSFWLISSDSQTSAHHWSVPLGQHCHRRKHWPQTYGGCVKRLLLPVRLPKGDRCQPSQHPKLRYCFACSGAQHLLPVIIRLQAGFPVNWGVFRDMNGNISTSNVRTHKDYIEVELKPRFPLFGGWRSSYTLGN